MARWSGSIRPRCAGGSRTRRATSAAGPTNTAASSRSRGSSSASSAMSMASGKRVAVLGAGANGAGVGAELAAAGVDVTLIEQWPAHVEKMRADGLRIEMPEDRVLEVSVEARHLCEVAEIREPFDVVLMLMKAYD